jgi:transcriptional regulator with XRE-family HTH domain
MAPPAQRHLLGNDLVREARRRAGLTQRELAERVGSTQSSVARLESGRTAPSFESVLHLVRACGFDLDVMLVERDHDDWRQAARLRDLTADERARRHDRVIAQMYELRRAGRPDAAS